jgi:hypothetical protein
MLPQRGGRRIRSLFRLSSSLLDLPTHTLPDSGLLLGREQAFLQEILSEAL